MICARAVASAIVTPDTNTDTNTDPVTPDTHTAIVPPDTDTADTDTADTDTPAATDKRYDTGSGAASQDGQRGCLCRFRYKTCGE
jgi:hypothetical protein